MQSNNLAQAIDRDAQDKTMLESDLQNLKNTQKYYEANVEVLIPGSPASVKNEKLIDLNNKIHQLKSNLAAMESVYGPNYPEIGTTKAALESYQKQANELEAEETVAAATASCRSRWSKGRPKGLVL
jgi:capsule polysaccharide export protein KpsE/RkpR